MTSKARWLVGIAMVTALIAVSMGFAAAQGGQTSPSTGGMMGSGSATGGMMAGVDMDAMHEQMIAAATGNGTTSAR